MHGGPSVRQQRGWLLILALLAFVGLYMLWVWVPWSSVGGTPSTGLTAVDSPIDAVAFICMGFWTQTTILDHAIASLRETGRWSGPIYVITDRDDGWPSLRDGYGATIVHVEAQASKLAIHSFKCKMFEVLPAAVRRVLYMDADIVVSRPLVDFFTYLDVDLSSHGSEHNMGFFRDSGSHFWGFCTDCDYWHGGVMLATREQSEPCLHKWCEAIHSGKFKADQPALDYISAHEPVCSGMFAMDSRFLMFMKDYTSIFLQPVKTFSHVTAAGRLEEQSWFYRLIVRMKLGLKM